MPSFFDFTIGSAVFIVFGFLPIFLFLLQFDLKANSRILIAIGYAPVLLALINTTSVIIGIQDSALRYLVILACWGGVLFYFRKNVIQLNAIFKMNLLKPILIGLLFGLGYWLIAFYSNNTEEISLNFDVIWNLGHASELKNHFLPKDPHWDSNSYFIYHFLTNMYLAGLSNFSGLNILDTLNAAYLFTTISIFIIIALFAPASATENLLIFVFILFSSYSNDWTLFRAFHGHISSQAASTFYWSLPIFISSLHIWQLMDEKRESLPTGKIVSISFVSTLALIFSKGTYVAVFVFLEMISLLKVMFVRSLVKWESIRHHAKLILSYLWYPIFFFLFFLLMRSSRQIPVFVGIEIRDFAQFASWNPIYPFIAVYCVTIGFLFLEVKNLKAMRWDLISCSVFNFVLFFILKHAGYSDLYFGFNAIIFNFLFLISLDSKRKITSYLVSFFICGVCFFYLIKKDAVTGFNSFNFSAETISPSSTSNGSVPLKEIKEYLILGDSLPNSSLILAPQPRGDRFFLYSAFLGKRIWNENSTYSTKTITSYLPWHLFLKQEKFIPEYFSDIPKNRDQDKAFERFHDDLAIDTLENENPINRYKVYNTCVFSNSPDKKIDSIMENGKWSHIIVRTDEMARINDWMKKHKQIKGKYIVIFECNENSTRVTK